MTHTTGRRRSNRTCSEPVSPCYGGRSTSPTATRNTWIAFAKLIPGSPPPQKRSKSPLPPLRSRQLRRRQPGPRTVRGPLRQRPDTANTRKWSTPSTPAVEEILAYHTTKRVSNRPLESINNLHPGPTTRRTQVHQPQQTTQPAESSSHNPRNPRNMTTTPTASPSQPHIIAQAPLWALRENVGEGGEIVGLGVRPRRGSVM